MAGKVDSHQTKNSFAATKDNEVKFCFATEEAICETGLLKQMVDKQ
ncbi:MAG: hypothetical protein ACXVBF_10910 [Flavisolibacter sp.]